jgi:hypothetical protein
MFSVVTVLLLDGILVVVVTVVVKTRVRDAVKFRVRVTLRVNILLYMDICPALMTTLTLTPIPILTLTWW